VVRQKEQLWQYYLFESFDSIMLSKNSSALQARLSIVARQFAATLAEAPTVLADYRRSTNHFVLCIDMQDIRFHLYTTLQRKQHQRSAAAAT
jgi:hypothetical protein